MISEEILRHVDHTLLKPYATWDEIDRLCRDAIAYHTASVCIPPCYVRRVREAFDGAVPICTVIGFPFGYSVTAAKVAETEQAVREGASEIDMVINIADVKNHDFAAVEAEIAAIRRAAPDKLLKVIVETCYLDEQEKRALCAIVTNACADYIKTSTGYGTAGATLADIELFRQCVGPGVRIKAAGGIRSVEDMIFLLRAGADRLGSSSALRLLSGEEAGAY